MLTFNGTSGLTFPDGTTQNTQALPGMRNRIINGDMRIDQRYAGAAVTNIAASNQYVVDRFYYSASQASKFTIQQNAGSVTPPQGFIKYLGVTSSSAYAVISTDAFHISQVIEGVNTADFDWGKAAASAITVSFWVRSSLTGTFGGAIRNTGQTRSYPFTFTISAANTWEYKTITIPGDTTGTWATDNTQGLYLSFSLGVGSTYSGTAGSWQAGNLINATGSVSVVGTSGATFYITGVQLEKGSTATPFEVRPYGQEILLCQRYYEVLTATWRGYTVTGAVNYGVECYFKATKRAVPSIVGSNFSTGGSNFPGFGGSIAYIDSVDVYAQASVAGGAFWYVIITASAEL